MDTTHTINYRHSFLLNCCTQLHCSTSINSLSLVPTLIASRNLESVWPYTQNQKESPKLSIYKVFSKVNDSRIHTAFTFKATPKYRRGRCYEDRAHRCTIFVHLVTVLMRNTEFSNIRTHILDERQGSSLEWWAPRSLGWKFPQNSFLEEICCRRGNRTDRCNGCCNNFNILWIGGAMIWCRRQCLTPRSQPRNCLIRSSNTHKDS